MQSNMNTSIPPADRERAIVQSLRRITRAVDLHSRWLGKQHGLTAPQLVALAELQRSGALSAGELARHIHLSPATVSGILDRLEWRGLVRRVASARDRRRVDVELTGAGRELLQQAPSPLQDRFRLALAELAEWEQLMLLAALERVASMMDADTMELPPLPAAEVDLGLAGGAATALLVGGAS